MGGAGGGVLIKKITNKLQQKIVHYINIRVSSQKKIWRGTPFVCGLMLPGTDQYLRQANRSMINICRFQFLPPQLTRTVEDSFQDSSTKDSLK